MEKIIKANVMARCASLEPGDQAVSLFAGAGFSCTAVYVQQQQSYVIQATENQLLIVVDGSGDLGWQDDGQAADLPLMKGDFITLAKGGAYEITNLSTGLLVLGLCIAGD